MTPSAPSPAQVEAFLAARHGSPVSRIEALPSGFWSAAFGYHAGDRDLVVRFGSIREGFEMDRHAVAFARIDLPIPEVLEVGDAFDGAYAISVRHGGRFLESIEPHDAPAAGAALERTLAALRLVPAPDGASCSWYPPGPARPDSTWRRWLLDALVDQPNQRVRGWRSVIAADAALDRLFTACERRVTELVDVCPERRDLVHGDLLNRNVLLSLNASHVNAVFSWKCSVRGDFMFDVAWCTFWGPWHSGIDALDLWGRTFAASSLAPSALGDAALRHHCYELQIGASHLGWHAWTRDAPELAHVARRLGHILERGPLAARPA